jgi:ABC-type Fe3+ transport system permease subunit
MNFLKIYCVFCIIVFILIELCIYEGIQKAKRKYADKIKENRNKAKANPIETLCVHIRMFIACFIPIVNLGMFWLVLFNGIQVQENAIKK